jgi:hypothetical protein
MFTYQQFFSLSFINTFFSQNAAFVGLDGCHLLHWLSPKTLLLQELGNVNPAFENDSGEVDTQKEFSPSYGFRTSDSTNEKRNVVCII